jgi:hypothetical protein
MEFIKLISIKILPKGSQKKLCTKQDTKRQRSNLFTPINIVSKINLSGLELLLHFYCCTTSLRSNFGRAGILRLKQELLWSTLMKITRTLLVVRRYIWWPGVITWRCRNSVDNYGLWLKQALHKFKSNPQSDQVQNSGITCRLAP